VPTFNLRKLKTKPKKATFKTKRKVEFENINNNTKTSQIYQSRAAYKKQVNEQNLPMGLKNKNNKNLDNQLDLWYEEPQYGRVDYQNRAIKNISLGDGLKTVNNTNFQLIDFVADAANNFFEQYNIQRNTTPGSILNNINVVRAYSKEENYKTFFDELYIKFFNEVLNDIKYSNKIKNIEDFINIFHTWSLSQDDPVTEAGFYRSKNYNIYNTGLAFDFYEIQSEDDKKKILNDPRFPVVNYVAKVNGLRIDPNYPGRLIADINSIQMVKLYASKVFPDKNLEEIPELIYKNYFTPIDYFDSSINIVMIFLRDIISVYNRFIEKYTYRTDFSLDTKTVQKFKKKFNTNKLKRNKVTKDFFFIENPDGSKALTEYAVKTYVNFRLSEEKITISEKELQYLIKKLTIFFSTSNSNKFINSVKFEEKLYTNTQGINFLENYIFSRKIKNPKQKKDFVFFFGRGKERILTSIEKAATLALSEDGGGFLPSGVTGQTFLIPISLED